MGRSRLRPIDFLCAIYLVGYALFWWAVYLIRTGYHKIFGSKK